MKHLLLAATVLGLAGTIGTANAAPLTSDSIAIWNALTPSSGSGSPGQQGLPNATAGFGGPLGLITSAPPVLQPYSHPINYNDGTDDTIGGFFTTAGLPVPGSCTSPCPGTTLSQGSFAQATVMEFRFTVATAGTLTIEHDDGVSLFVPGTETSTGTTNNLFGDNATGAAIAAPQALGEGPATVIALAAGTYDLWYNESNGLPAVLETDYVPIPAPLIGHGLLALLAIGGVLFGGKLLETFKARDLHTA
jgi:hypothetical protein